MKALVNFLFETEMLRKTPRSGFQFLGSGSESVAEHVLSTIFIGYTLCKTEPLADEGKVLKLCLLHDLLEARTGDMNYVNKKYMTADEGKALAELTAPLFFGAEIRTLLAEFKEMKTLESRLAHDADQLALIFQLKELGDLGNKYSGEWIAFARKRLVTEPGIRMAEGVLETDWTEWWFQDKSDWWINGGNDRENG